MNKPDSDFESLRQLLALKKHEVPPPGYFHRFSDEVVTRIRAGASARPETAMERLFAEAPWLIKLIKAFESKPAFTGVFASALCLLIVAGIVYSDNPTTPQDSIGPDQMSQANSSMAAMTPAFLNVSASDSQASLDSSTNPIAGLESSAAPNASPFGNPNPLLQLQPVTFNH